MQGRRKRMSGLGPEPKELRCQAILPVANLSGGECVVLSGASNLPAGLGHS